jgi:hypothetical protein
MFSIPLRHGAGALFCILLPSVATADAPSSREAFIARYQPNAEQLRKFYSSVRVRFRATFGLATPRHQITEAEARFTFSNFLIDGESRFEDGQTGKTITQRGRAIEGRNALYGFSLQPKANSEYVVKSIILNSGLNTQPLCFLNVPYADPSRLKRTYLEIAQDRSIEVLLVRECMWRGSPATELRARYKSIHPQSLKEITPTVGFFFVPERNWVCEGLRSYDGPAPDSGFFTEEAYLYEDRPDVPCPVLKRIEVWNKIPGSDAKELRPLRKTEILEFQQGIPLPDSSFRLTAFGLPEPDGVKWPGFFGNWFWLTAGAVFLLFLGSYFSWRARKRRTLPDVP